MRQKKGFLHLLPCLIIVAAAWGMPAQAEDTKSVVLLTLEWPPYTSVKLADNGFISRRVKAAYAATGQDAKIGFFSWRRAMRLPYTDHRFTAFFPAYPSPERKQVCHFSDPIGVSQLGLAQMRRKPLQWTHTDDLERYRVGVVSGYVNEDSFDRLAKAGSIKTAATETDAENLLSLVQGRVDGAVIDAAVFDWLLNNDKRLRPWRERLQMNERLLVTWPLFVCFRKDAEGAALRDHFNAGLAALNEDISHKSIDSAHEELIKPVEKPAPTKQRL
jgi:polar amino acid transport system substrate-binding protein